MIRTTRVALVIGLVAAAVFGFGGWWVLPAGVFLLARGGRSRGSARSGVRRWRRRRRARYRVDGLDEVWDLGGLRVRLGNHRLVGSDGTEVSVHDLERVVLVERDVVLVGLDGETIKLGRARAERAAVAQAVAAIDAGVRGRRRGGLEDRQQMREALGNGVRSKQALLEPRG